jgi:Metallo-beta-lactamase superfamily
MPFKEVENSMKNDSTHLTRRTIIGALLAVPALALPRSPNTAPTRESLDTEEGLVRASLKGAKGTKLVLLGTGAGPLPGQNRHMQSSVLVHNDTAYVVDCGLGITDLFARTGIPFSVVRSIFITHHHPDHNVEYGPFLIIKYRLDPWIEAVCYGIRAAADDGRLSEVHEGDD